MYEKLAEVKEKYNMITEKMADPDVIADQDVFQKYAKELSDMKPIVEKYDEYATALKRVEEAEEILARKAW